MRPNNAREPRYAVECGAYVYGDGRTELEAWADARAEAERRAEALDAQAPRVRVYDRTTHRIEWLPEDEHAVLRARA